MYRYIAITWNPNGLESVRTSQSIVSTLASKGTEWRTVYEAPGTFVMDLSLRKKSPEVHNLANGSGVVLGTLFSSHCDQLGTCNSLDLSQGETRAILCSAGQHLIDHYWGSYVAILCERESARIHVLRDPTANLPCYHTRWREIDIFFSHVEDCIRFLPISFSVNRDYLIRWLMIGRLMDRECGLREVSHVQGGERFTLFRGDVSRAFLWNPVKVSRAPRIEPPTEAAKTLRSVVQKTINAWASCYDEIAHKTSGGLDSSIVAGCLANVPSRPNLLFLHLSVNVGFEQERLYLEGIDKRMAERMRSLIGGGDERYFARLVSERWGIPLIERERTISMDLSRMWQAPVMTSPSGYFTSIESDDAQIQLVKKHGTQAFFTGHAGDSVFLETFQPFSAIDYAYLHGIDAKLWHHIFSSCRLSKQSVWSVLGKAINCGILGRQYRSPLNVLDLPTLLKEEVVACLKEADFSGGWSARASGLPPGKVNHIAGLRGSAHYDCVYHSQSYADDIDPLNSQPVWELMLQIPTYTALTGGVSRGLARLAFADLLPDEIRRRQIKGTGAPFYQKLVRKNKSLLQAVLLDGLLVREGYLDRQKLSDCLGAEEPFLTVGAIDLLSYLSAEIWLQQWDDISRQSVASQEPYRIPAP